MRNATFALAAGIALAACHSARPNPSIAPGYQDERGIDRREVLLSDWKPTYPQQCAVAQYPTVLPSVDSIISTSDMPFLLKQGGIDMTRGSALLSLKWDSTGAIARAHVIEGDIPEDVAPVLEQVVLAALHSQLPGRAWGVRLRIDLDSVPRYRLGRSERCLPVPVYKPSAGAHTVGGAAQFSSAAQVVDRQYVNITFNVLVGADGKVIDATPLGSSSVGDVEMVRRARDLALNTEYLPGRDDGVPTPMTVQRHEQFGRVVVLDRH